MRRPTAPRSEIDAWLSAHGWHAGREDEPENAAKAGELIGLRVRGSAEQGFPLEPWDEVRRFVASFVGLEFPMPRAPERVFRANPTFGYTGDAEDITELAENLGQRLFPVGWESTENGIVLLDDTGRFFYLHHTGPYFLGADETQALSSLMTGDQEDAEGHFV
ncbi:SUKH-3 domain-containing protein [Streptomyces sp. t39]|uniref:SUKH-3 domain-containing protein n=1 Tax=Streptomyces sp. t39 TaxID=1828156 RepID=UPI0011CD642F|nr:SUKH-3 domain-containing protein [Streptomyces sp. t39]TXS51452.1 hypothetical protein EAO77_26690 [Streptomyces sp. t39]